MTRHRRPAPATDPFTVLGLEPSPGLSDEDVRIAWRRAASDTHPDREDGGDPERFAAAAAAYTALRTRFGRGEAAADLGAAPPRAPKASSQPPARAAQPRLPRAVAELAGRARRARPDHRHRHLADPDRQARPRPARQLADGDGGDLLPAAEPADDRQVGRERGERGADCSPAEERCPGTFKRHEDDHRQ